MKYMVLPAKEILRRSRWFHAGQEVGMAEDEAGRFINEIAPVEVPDKPDGGKPETRKSSPKRR